MNDESPTPDADLASAALDDEVTAAERARVVGSPALSEELSFYRDLRSNLADVRVPPPGRESAIAAALAVFDQARLNDASPDHPQARLAETQQSGHPLAPTVVSLHERRRRQYRWLAGAAAAAVVLVVGVGVVSNLGQGSNDESASLATDSAPNQAATAGQPEAPGAAQDADTDAAATATVAASTAGSIAAAEANEPVPEAAATPSGEFEISGPAEVSPWGAAPVLQTAEDVIAFVAGDLFASRAGSDTGDSGSPATTAGATAPDVTTDGATTADSTAETTAATAATTTIADGCPVLASGPSAPAIYQGTEVYVVLDEAASEILIVEPINCDTLTTIPRS